MHDRTVTILPNFNHEKSGKSDYDQIILSLGRLGDFYIASSGLIVQPQRFVARVYQRLLDHSCA